MRQSNEQQYKHKKEESWFMFQDQNVKLSSQFIDMLKGQLMFPLFKIFKSLHKLLNWRPLLGFVINYIMSIYRHNLLKPVRSYKIDKSHPSSGSDIDDQEQNSKDHKGSNLQQQKQAHCYSYSTIAKAHLKERPILQNKKKLIKKNSKLQVMEISESQDHSSENLYQREGIVYQKTITNPLAIRKRAKEGITVSNRVKMQFDKKDESSQECSICLSDLKSLHAKQIGTLPCKHAFCLACITESSKFNNRCPYCRANYDHIRCDRRLIPVEDTNLNEEFEDEEDPCYVCGRNDDFERLLECDFCEYAYCHTYCDSRLRSDIPPAGEWYCNSCEELMRSNVQMNRQAEDEQSEEYYHID